MTAETIYCTDKQGKPKERFSSAQAARRALARKRKFRGRRWPSAFHCPCGAWHYTAGGA